MTADVGKLCIGSCGQVKLLAAFGQDSSKPDGRQPRCRDCKNAAQRAGRDAGRAAVFGYYGTACACCGATEQLTIDHISGGGAKHRRALRVRSSGFYAWLITQGFPPGYQTLCWPCNDSKDTGPACRLWHGDPCKRRCTGKCGRVKAIDQFGRDVSKPTGRRERCRDCQNEARRGHVKTPK